MTQIVSKSEFARLLGVSPARVSQMISEGKIDGAALIGEGRKAKIDFDVAREQVRLRTDLGQSLGNGLATKVQTEPVHEPAHGAEDVAHALDVAAQPATPMQPLVKTEEQIRRDKLEEFKVREAARKDRAGVEDELKRAGTLIMREDAEMEIAAIVAIIYDQLDGAPDRIGKLLAAEFEMTNLRDVVFFLRQQFRDLKTQLSGELTRRADGQDEVVTVPVEDVTHAKAGQSETALADRGGEDTTAEARHLQ